VKKQTFICLSIIISLLISVTLYIIISNNTTETEAPSVDQNNITEGYDKAKNDYKSSIIIDEEPEEETVTTQFKDFLSDTLQNAIDFFLKKDIQMVAIGDSLTEGIGDETDQAGYVGILEQTFNDHKQTRNFSIENYGKRGNRTDQLLKRLEQKEIQQAIKTSNIVLMTIGANDIMQVFKENITNLKLEPFREEKKQFERRLHQIFSTIKDYNEDTHIYLLGIYNPFAQYFQDIEELEMIVNEWNETSEATVKQYDRTTFIPIKDLFRDENVHLFADDNFHPNRRGYERMAYRILNYLTEQEE